MQCYAKKSARNAVNFVINVKSILFALHPPLSPNLLEVGGAGALCLWFNAVITIMCEDFPDINEYLAKLDLCLYAFHGLVSIL